MGTIRAFIAIKLPDDAKEALGKVGRALSSQMPSGAVRWVMPERVHLTLRFLGETEVAKLPTLATELDRVMASHTSFELRLDQLGSFPNWRRPRVIWVGVQGDLEQLQSIHKELSELLEPLGWEPEARPYRPHLTLGRVKDARKLSGTGWDVEVEDRTIPVDAVHLIQSDLRPTGPIYTVRHTSVLAVG